jgi:hypothetical protein
MNKTAVCLLNSLAVAVLAVASIPAFAAAQRSFVASNGNDANPCSLTSPCRSFGAAMAQTVAGGAIIALGSAGDGSVTINQDAAIYATVLAPGREVLHQLAADRNAWIQVARGAVNVVLRGLEINGLGTSPGSGILSQAAASLVIDRCTVTNFGGQAYQSRRAANH